MHRRKWLVFVHDVFAALLFRVALRCIIDTRKLNVTQRPGNVCDHRTTGCALCGLKQTLIER